MKQLKVFSAALNVSPKKSLKIFADVIEEGEKSAHGWVFAMLSERSAEKCRTS
jgi:hypothetical protein